MLTFDDIKVGTDHELVRVARDPEAGLLAVLAVHSTALGPAMGGVRRRSYDTLDDALEDALRLSAAMTLKNSAAGLPLGGGKSVIIDADAEPDGAMLDAFADAIASLDGLYVGAEDIGTTPAVMDRLASRTRWVAGQSVQAGGNGDPSDATAATVFGSLRAAAKARWGSDSLAGKTVGVLGTGKVGGALARLSSAAGAKLVLADVQPGRAESLAHALPSAEAVAPDVLLTSALDILAPCAVGGLLDLGLADRLAVEVVCGAANNILASDAVAERLLERGILYVPDFVANAGGIIHVGGHFLGWEDRRISDSVQAAVARTAWVLSEAARRELSPLAVGLALAAERLPAAATTTTAAGTPVAAWSGVSG